MNTIYEAYAAQDGNVHYKEFIEHLLFREDAQPASNSRLTHTANQQNEQDNKLELSKKEAPR